MNKFDEMIDRKNTQSLKWDGMKPYFGRDDILPMWVADMDFRPPAKVIEALQKRVEHGVFGYTITPETVSNAITKWISVRYEWQVDNSWLLYSPGVVPSIKTAIQAFTNPGDKVLLQSPVYTPFFQMIERNGREVSNSPLVLKNGRYEIDFVDFEEKLKLGVKLFLLCSPHNPAGRVWAEEDLVKMADLCKQYGVLIVADEIHADLVASPHKHLPLASLDSTFADITITLMAPSKTFNIAGLQASYMVVSNNELRQKLAAEQASDAFSMLNTFAVIAMEAAYTYGHEWLDQVLNYISANIKLVKKEIKEHLPLIKVIEPEGSFLIWLDCRELGLSHVDLKKRILEKGKLALNFGDSYGLGGEGFVRMNVGCPKDTVIEGLSRLRHALS